VCTECGVVDEERLLDSLPEWREYGDAEDLAKGRPPPARSGLVPVDESLYVGGLQPTTLSRGVYGGESSGRLGLGGSNASTLRKRLLSAAHKIDHRMARSSKESIEAARMHYLVQSRKRKRRKLRRETDANSYKCSAAGGGRDEGCYYDDDTDADEPYCSDEPQYLRPEYEQLVLQEEEDVQRRRAALYAEKWSLDRAIRLCGNAHEVSLLAHSSEASNCGAMCGDLEDQLDATLRLASRDLYRAYSMLLRASRALNLPDRVQGEAASLLCRYAVRRDGLGVRGIVSIAAAKATNPAAARTRNRIDLAKTKNSPASSRKEREARAALAEHNKIKQAGALCSAVLVYACRRAGYARPMEEVCTSIRPFREEEVDNNQRLKAEVDSVGPDGSAQANQNSVPSEIGFIQKRHCSKAMKQLREALPDVGAVQYPSAATVTPSYTPASHARTSSSAGAKTTTATVPAMDLESASNLVDEKLRGLHLPPVAQAMVRTLVLSAIADATTAAALTAPENDLRVMPHPIAASVKQLPTLCGAMTLFVCHAGAVMQRLASQACHSQLQKQQEHRSLPTSSMVHASRRVDALSGVSAPLSNDPVPSSSLLMEHDGKNLPSGSLLDLEGVGEALSREQRAYEMGRIWDAWSSQTPWSRSIADIEQSTGASGSAVLQLYRRQVFPRRLGLLDRVRDAATVAADTATDETSPASDGPGELTAPPSSFPAAGDALGRAMSGSLQRTPLSSVLLPQIPLVAPLLNEEAR
jgi:transcription initiation factor TFIIIB Brf1 subunit/transcription initiation factor TFIIB